MDPAITRLAEMPDELTIDQVAYVLSRHRDFVTRAIKKRRLIARADEGRGEGLNRRYVISRESVLRYILGQYTVTTYIVADIAATWPDLREWAATTAQGGTPQLPARSKPRLRVPAAHWHPDQLALFTDTAPQ